MNGGEWTAAVAFHCGQNVEKRFNASVVVGKRVEGRWGRVRDLAMGKRGCRGPMPQGDAGVLRGAGCGLRAGMRGRKRVREQSRQRRRRLLAQTRVSIPAGGEKGRTSKQESSERG